MRTDPGGAPAIRVASVLRFSAVDFSGICRGATTAAGRGIEGVTEAEEQLAEGRRVEIKGFPEADHLDTRLIEAPARARAGEAAAIPRLMDSVDRHTRESE
jgi:hypothetical protein